ncbi:FkbM family methyltransferase [Rhizobium binxianense]
MSRNIYIDLGANLGDTIAKFIEWHPSHLIWGFEANPHLIPDLIARFADRPAVTIVGKAVWTKSGTRKMYLGHPLSGTVILGKKEMPQAQIYEIDYQTEVEVETIDFSKWLQKTVSPDDNVTIKMDIEGAEYAIIRRMIKTGAISLVDTLICEFHQNRYPISLKTHNDLVKQISHWTRLVSWH